MTGRRTQRPGPTLVALFALGVIAVGVTATLLATRRPSDPIGVVEAWADARYAGEIETAMSYLADEGEILGLGIYLPGAREQLQAAFEGQRAAGWSIEETECVVDGERVTCRYRQTDEILQRGGWT